MRKSRIAITLGDPAGIGPEIICKLFLDRDFVSRFNLSVVGYNDVILSTYSNILKTNKIPEINIIEPPEFIKVSGIVGQVNKDCGRASMLFIEKACQLARKNLIDAIVTAPINKKSINLAGYKFKGHTDFLAYIFKAVNYSMLLVSDKMKVIFVTTHIPVKEVSKNLNVEKVYHTILNAYKSCRYFNIEKPVIGVCALNPHSSDEGVIGDEEDKIIKPAVLKARISDITIEGPYPSDTIFNRMLKGDFDIVVSMYHDQGMIPLKLTSFGSAVNITVGLPVIRTSVDHGTAFDIAGSNIASEKSLKRAVEVADELLNNGRFIKSL
jgi:4-hydroxythreonine-4-phosphate dehydrogenase